MKDFMYWAAVVILATTTAPMLALSVQAHDPDMHLAEGQEFWAQKYRVPSGDTTINCCSPGDMAFIPHHVANAAQIGEFVTAEFPSGGTQTVKVKAIHPTEDPQGRAAVTKFGCLFKMYGF